MPGILVAGLLVVIAALGYALLASSSSPVGVLRRERRNAPGEADGAVPLLGALRQAARDAADDGVEVFVTSAWRSPKH